MFDEALARLDAAWQKTCRSRSKSLARRVLSLLAAADAREVDLIAVGFRGTSLFERLVLGSVSRAVVHSAHVPVLVVKSEPVNEDDLIEPSRNRPVRATNVSACWWPTMDRRSANALPQR